MAMALNINSLAFWKYRLEDQILRFLLALLLLTLTPPMAGAQVRLASLNLCSDLLLLEYFPKEHIAGLTRQASDQTLSPLAEQAKALPQVTRNPEQLIKVQADILLLAQDLRFRSTGRKVNNEIKKIILGYPGSIQYWPESLRKIRDAGISLDAAAITDAKAAIESIDGILGSKTRVLMLAPRWFGLGNDHMAMQWLTIAGARPWRDVNGWSMKLDPETLLLDPPDVIIMEDHGPAPSLATNLLDQRLTERLETLGTNIVTSPPKYWTCPGPWSINWLKQLAMLLER